MRLNDGDDDARGPLVVKRRGWFRNLLGNMGLVLGWTALPYPARHLYMGWLLLVWAVHVCVRRPRRLGMLAVMAIGST